MVDQKKDVAPAPAKPAPGAVRRPTVGWCVGEVAPGQTLQDVPREKIIESAAAHEARWKGRFNTQQRASQASMNWTRGHG